MSEHAAYTEAELAAYNTHWDTISTEKSNLSDRYRRGLAEGERVNKAEMLLFILQQKFQTVPEQYHQKVLQASLDLLQKWIEKVLECSTIEEVFKL